MDTLPQKMKIELQKAGKQFNKEWIFKDVNYSFESGNSYALLGPNGSGKSTFIKLVSGFLTPTRGTVNYLAQGKSIQQHELYRQIAISAPYLALIEDFTLSESLHFQENLFPFMEDYETERVIKDVLELGAHSDKQLKFFSSGMLQRVKLAVSVIVDKPVLLLDEPATNLDKKGVDWYHRLIEKFAKDKLLIVASNREDEYAFCKKSLQIEDFKPT